MLARHFGRVISPVLPCFRIRELAESEHTFDTVGI